MIRQLEEKLWKKEGDLELVCQELKWHRLELENKEETYNKIFTNGYNVNVNELKFPAERTANVNILVMIANSDQGVQISASGQEFAHKRSQE